MLLLTRKKQESIILGVPGSSGIQVRVTVLSVSGKQVKLGFEAEGQVAIQRGELWEREHGVELGDSTSNERGQRSAVNPDRNRADMGQLWADHRSK